MNLVEFEKHMKVIEGFLDKQDSFADFFHKEFAPDCYRPIVTFGWDLLKSHIDLVASLAGDEGDWIDYYLWECDRGRSPGTWFDKQGKEYKLRNHKDLWKAINHDKK